MKDARSTAVGPWAKFYIDYFVRIDVKAKQIFRGIWIVMENLLAK